MSQDQLVDRGALLGDAIDLQVDRAALDHAQLTAGLDRAEHGRLFEVLAQIPGAAGFAGHQLQIAAGHVEAGAVAEDQVFGVALGHPEAGGADGHHQLHLVLVVLGTRRIGHAGAGLDGGGGVLDEIEGARGGLVHRALHLDGVGVVVATDAEDATDREALRAAFDGQGEDGVGSKAYWSLDMR